MIITIISSECITEWPKKVRTLSVLFIHNHILKALVKKSEKLYKVSNMSSNVSIKTQAYKHEFYKGFYDCVV